MHQIKSDVQQETKSWYQQYYKKKGKYRNDLLRNPEVLFQTVAHDVALIKGIRYIVEHCNKDIGAFKILDVGCGGGVVFLIF